MKVYVVITSIGNPTKSVVEYAKNKEMHIVVIGDRKTPIDWHYNKVTYISPQMQEDLFPEFSRLLPWDHYSRKMIGYLWSIKEGADVIFDTDDDNIPYENWSLPAFNGEFDTVLKDLGHDFDFFNIYKLFSDEFIWPRGYPLDMIISSLRKSKIRKKFHNKIGIFQSLVDRNPDVDAIYRLLINKDVYFKRREPVVLDSNIFCPFNSQATFFTKECFELLYLPAFVTFRFTDILRGIVAQPILWNMDLRLGFSSPIVYQIRNYHNLMKDFESEIPCYLNTHRALQFVVDALKNRRSSVSPIIQVYENIFRRGIVLEKELVLCKTWVENLRYLL